MGISDYMQRFPLIHSFIENVQNSEWKYQF